jgi:hypothetical protein
MNIVRDIDRKLIGELTEDLAGDLTGKPLAKIFCNCSKTA